MDSCEANTSKSSASREESGGQLVLAENPNAPLFKTLLQQLDTLNHKDAMMDRWLGETLKEEPYNGLGTRNPQ
ncbi:hypothetical protein M419DRAFT_93257 [Trichoderma reesei RUT C-30]|uniref:Uncharacterized protein n=1 Tax=Hypocrea jecorina (strain ATCC 56765 / BCRC 32924 / NRRL 11460 / Rut C-30) TaxID=1344414 RepID=A0A024RUQ1_HYPJR|nr:hypothetical protein M419DRAFT_93257 [Trichoderma reesei RUT C-30]